MTTQSNLNAYRWPSVVVQHGRAIELVVDCGNGTIAKFSWPKSGKRSMWLFTDVRGRQLMLTQFNKISVTVDEFMERFRAAGRVATDATDQWLESTGDIAERGSLVKVPEKRIGRIGRARSIAYYFDEKFRDGDPREHQFESAPLVKADNDNDPTLIVISGGQMEITRAGIEG
jgi:hypothetical protein